MTNTCPTCSSPLPAAGDACPRCVAVALAVPRPPPSPEWPVPRLRGPRPARPVWTGPPKVRRTPWWERAWARGRDHVEVLGAGAGAVAFLAAGALLIAPRIEVEADATAAEVEVVDPETWTPTIDPQPVAATAGGAVFGLEAEGCGYSRTGSAVAIDGRTLLTSWDLVAIDPTPTLFAADGTSLQAEVIGWEPEEGVAVLRVDALLDTWLRPVDGDGSEVAGEVVLAGATVPGAPLTATSAAALVMEPVGSGALGVRGEIGAALVGGAVLDPEGELIGIVLHPSVDDSGRLQRVLPYAAARPVVGRITVAPARPAPDCTVGGSLPDPDRYLGSTRFGAQALAVGSDPVLDVFVGRCGAGEPGACDLLAAVAPAGSDYLARALSCGGGAGAPPCSGAGQASPPAVVGGCLLWPRRDPTTTPAPAVGCGDVHDAEVVALGPAAEGADPLEDRCRAIVATTALSTPVPIRTAVVRGTDPERLLCLVSVPGAGMTGSIGAGDLRIAGR